MQFKLLGIQGATSIEVVTAATAKLSGAELVAAIASANLTKEEQKSILMKHGLSGAELEAAMQTLAHSAANTTATVTTGALTTATGGLSAAFRGLTVAMASNPIGAIAVAIATVIGVVSTAITVFSNWQNTIEDVKETANQLTTDFENQSKTISENTEKLKSLKSEFEKLSKGVSDYGENISLTGDEYERYKEIVQTILGISPSLIEGYDREGTALANKNGLLEKSIALMEEEQRLEKEKLTRTDNLTTLLNAGKENLNSAKDDVNNIKKPNDISFASTIKNGKSERSGFRSPIEKYIEHIIGVEKETWESESDYILRNYEEIYKHIDEIIADSQKNFTNDTGEYIGFTDTQAESFRNYLLQFKDYIDTQDEVNSEFNSYLQMIPESMREYSGLNDSSKTFISEWIKRNFTIDENTTEQDVENYSAKIRKFVKQIANDKDLQSLFDFGAELTTDKDNESLSVEAYQNKVKEFIDKVNNLNDEDTKLYIKTVFGFEEDDDDLTKDVDDKIQRVKNILVDSDDDKVSGLSMQELNIAYNISAEEGSLTFDELQAKIEETRQKAKENGFALSKDQTKELKSVHSDVDKLNKAYQNLFAGKLTTNDVAELVDLFPTLGEYVDWTDEKFGNLAEGIDKVIKERPQELISQLEEVLNTQDLSDEAKKSIQSMIYALKQLKPELKDAKTLIEDIQKAIKGVSSSISTLIGFTKEISSDGALSLSSIDTIMTDDTYKSLRPYINDMEGMQTAITELVTKQKDAYEDLYNAEMYENDYEAYHKAVQQKEQENENILSDSIKQIEDEIKYFNDAYDVDITNWDNLTDTKKNTLQNTNAELLSKQNQLINEFGQLYNDDVGNFADAIKDKKEIQKHFEESQVYSKINDLIVNDPKSYVGIDRNTGKVLRYASPELQTEINSILSTYGLSYADYANYRDYGKFTDTGNKALEDYLAKLKDKLVNAYTFTDKDWETITANIGSTGSSGSSSSGSSSSGSSSSSKNYIDWIERRLKKFAQTTKEVFSRVADYITFNGQNSQLRKAIDAIRDEIAVNEQSYQFYMEEANNVGLDPYWQWFVQNGARNISDIQDEVLREKISRYQELYDKAIECRNAISDLKETELGYATQMLGNVDKYFSNRISYVASDADYYNSLDTETQNFTKNYAEIRKSYNNQIAETENKSRELLNTLNNLVSSGSIKYQSDEWYEWIDKINQCNVEVRNLKKTLHSLYAEELQDIKDFWENRVSNLDNTISYINTSSGDNTQNIAKNYKEIKNAYSKQISYTNKEIVELQNKLNESVRSGDIQEYSDKWYEWVNIINQAKEKVIELKKNIHQLAVEELQDIKSYWENKSGVSENAVSYINTVSSDTTRKNNNNYKSLSTEYNNQLIYATNEVVMLQKRLNDAIKSGDIQKYSDDWYEWTNSIEQAKEKIIELRKNIHLLAVKEFEDIKTKYNNLISFISNKESLLNESINQTKAQGYIVSTKYYEALIQNERNNISNLSAKRNELYSSLQKAVKSGDIEEGSEEWHKMVEEINNVDLEIKKANTSLIEFNNSIREIQWQVFDLLQNKISQITKESDFLINLMKNDNLYVKEGQKAGQFTNEGLSTVGLHGVNYNVYMAQAGKYAEEILKIDKQLANDPYNQDLANRRKELLKLQQSMILSAEEEKQAIVNMVKEGINLELNALKKLIDKYNEALNSQKDLYDYQKKIKDQTKELTSLQKQLSAYAGDTSEETKAKIQKLQVSISEAKENLEETQYNQFISDHKKLLDNLYNEYEKVLNQRLDNVDGLISDMIANVNDNANTIKQTITEQSGSVGYNISSTMNDIWNNGTKPVLSEYNRNFINVSSNVITAINGLTNSINTMISKLDRAASSSNDVKTMTNEPTVGVNKDTPKVPDNSKNNNSNNNSSSNNGTNNNNSNNNSNNNLNNNSNNNNNKNNSNNKQGKKNNTKKRTDKENYGVALAIINGNYGWGSGDERKRKLEEKKFNYSKVQGIVNKLWDEGLVHSNAWIGKYYGIRELSPYHYKNFKLGTNRVNRNQLAWTQENNSLEAIIRPSDGAILTPLAREDMVLNSKATANIFDMANNPNKFIKESLFSNERFNKIPNINNTNNFSVSIDNVNFNLPNVKNYEEFFYAAQHDKRFEKMVQAMTVDKLFGGSSLKKFHI